MLLQALMQVRTLPRPQIAAPQISKVLTWLQISSWLLVIMQKGMGVGGGPAPSGKAHYNCLSRPHSHAFQLFVQSSLQLGVANKAFECKVRQLKCFMSALEKEVLN